MTLVKNNYQINYDIISFEIHKTPVKIRLKHRYKHKKNDYSQFNGSFPIIPYAYSKQVSFLPTREGIPEDKRN